MEHTSDQKRQLPAGLATGFSPKLKQPKQVGWKWDVIVFYKDIGTNILIYKLHLVLHACSAQF